MAILYPTPLANLVVEVGTRHCHQILFWMLAGFGLFLNQGNIFITLVKLHGARNLHVGAYNRPHELDEESFMELEESLGRLHRDNDHIILGDNFNFPSWDWKNNRTKPKCHYPALHNCFASLLDNTGLTQMVREPTRGDSTSDLICFNLPSNINKAEVIPGFSDHGIPIAEGDIQPIKRRHKPRSIHQYK